MDKSDLAEEIISALKAEGFWGGDKNTSNRANADPCLEFTKNNYKFYIIICEAGIKDANYPEIVWCGFSRKLQQLVDKNNTFFIVLDNQADSPKYILAKFGEVNFRFNSKETLMFDFRRPEYGNFFNTSSLAELVNEVLKTCQKKE